MKKTAFILLLCWFSAAAFAFSSAPAAEKAKDFTLKDLSGNSVSLNSFKGKTLLLAFFTTWCPACQDEIPKLEPIYKKYRSDKFQVVAVSIKENANSVRLFAGENKLSFPVLLDEKGEIAGAYKVRYIPRLFILGSSGDIKFSAQYIPAEEIEKEVKKALQ